MTLRCPTVMHVRRNTKSSIMLRDLLHLADVVITAETWDRLLYLISFVRISGSTADVATASH